MIPNISPSIKEYMSTFSFPEHPSLPVSFETLYKNGKDHLFDFKFPWYATIEQDPDMKTLEEFKRMFILNYWTRQIKAEVMGLFKIRLNAKLTEIMPKYSQLYESILIEYDPLINRLWNDSEKTTGNLKSNTSGDSNTVDGTKNKYGETNHSTTEQSGSSSGDTQSIDSDNPQTNFAGVDYASKMNRGQANTSDQNKSTTNGGRDGTNDTNRTVTNKTTGDREDSTDGNRNFSTKGFSGSSQTDNIIKYRDAILNLNKEISDQCGILFSGYHGHDYTIKRHHNW